ncbi:MULTISPECIES: hypothetical protein [Chryseobacterium]|uniref:Uncharacterized protein n=1 Tax=Chryseobacterium indoltheticum TaxID=254 RepID=A0A381FDY3_9FLAO|nr:MULTISPECIES: hypothetical protein [Chryseobacterium]MDQ8143271.1 hypothetical protein [Chryseobacterium sp. CFS15]SUX44322.1 Uncharacterised protein [Chryseobacterium indoltheticum]
MKDQAKNKVQKESTNTSLSESQKVIKKDMSEVQLIAGEDDKPSNIRTMVSGSGRKGG